MHQRDLVDGEDGEEHGHHDERHHHAHGQDDGRFEEADHAPELAAHLGLHRVSGLEQHVFQAPGLLAHADHVDGERREWRVFLHGRRHRTAALHGIRQTVHGAPHDLVGHDVADHGEGSQHRYSAPQHGPEGAREACRLHLDQEGPDQRYAQEQAIPLEPSLGRPRPQPPTQDGPDEDQHPHPPVRLEDEARREQDLRGERNGLAHVREDGGEPGDHEGHQEYDGAGPHGRDDDRVGQGGDDGLREGLARFLEFGQPAQGRLEHAALLARPDHVDVEAREGAGMMLGEGVAQGGTAPHAVEEVGHHRLHARVGGQFLQDGERAVERHARLDERGELLGQGQQISRADAAGQIEIAPRPALRLGGDLDGEVRLAVQPLDDGAGVRSFHDPVHRLSPAVGRAIGEHGHGAMNLPA